MIRRLLCERLETRAVPTAGYLLTNEHADVGINYTAIDGWEMAIHNDDIQVEYAPGESVQYVHPVYAPAFRPAGSNYDFIGVAAGQPYYRLAQSQDLNLLYHGFGAEEVAPGTFGAYEVGPESHNRESGVAPWGKVRLVSVSGPGSFSVWYDSGGMPTRYMSSFNDGVANPELDGIDYSDGISADDAIWLIAGAHRDVNFGFTAPGRYELDFQPTAKIGGVFNTGPSFTFIYSVGNVGQLGFNLSSYSINEAAGNATITVQRTGGSDGSVSVDYATGGGTATATGPTADYTPTFGRLVFDDLEVSKTFTIPIINDTAMEPSETIGLTLSNFRPTDKFAGEPSNPPLEAAITTATLTVQDDDGAFPATVTSTVVNGGAAQRSRVTSLDVHFSAIMSALPLSSFQLRRISDNALVGLNTATSDVMGHSVATLTFPGALSEFGSLADGSYQLTVFGASVLGPGGIPLDGDANGTSGGDYHFSVSRKFGDADGDGDVDNADFVAFRLAFGAGPSVIFDSDGDGDVDNADFTAFRQRFGT